MKKYDKSRLNHVKRGANRAEYDVVKINEIIDAGFIAYVGYIYDGYPISIPMAYTRQGNEIYLHGSTGNRMLRSILDAEKTSLTIMHLDALVIARSGLHHSVNYRSATLFGKCTLVQEDKEKANILEKIVNHMVPNHWESLRPMHQNELDRTLVVRFTIETASAKVRDEGVNDEPEDYNLQIWAGLIPIRQICLPPISDKKLLDNIPVPEHILDYYKKNK